MKLTRRDFVKTNAIAATTTAGVTIPGINSAYAKSDNHIRWDKVPCRFCGTGCSILAGTMGGKIIATQGNPDAPVNKELVGIHLATFGKRRRRVFRIRPAKTQIEILVIIDRLNGNRDTAKHHYPRR